MGSRGGAIAAVAIAATAFGCDFSGSPVSPNGDGGRQVGDDAAGCRWSFNPRHVPDVCGLDAPGEVILTGPATIDTDAPSQDFEIVSTSDGVEVVRWVMGDLTVSGKLEVVGSKPLLIVSHGTIEIDGAFELTASLTKRPAGADDAILCEGSVGSRGDDGGGGAGGGGGGAFAANGAQGEDGNSGGIRRDGGSGGNASPLIGFRGGCPGGRGGEDNNNEGGLGGGGGGAIHFVARDKIMLTGGAVITTGGGGGGAGQNRQDAGGGGGGSGGYIGIESPAVEIASTAFIASNGGAGGGGTSTADDGELPGESGRPSATPALGGSGARSNGDDGGGDGGSGGAIGSPAATPDSDPVGAAGGGGGSIGVVTVGTVGPIPNQAQFSPAFVPFVLSPL